VADRVTYCVVEQVGGEGAAVKFHALQVKDGEVDPGDHPDLVNAVCTTQLPRRDVKQDRSWEALRKMSEQGDLAGQSPLCGVCKDRAGRHQVHAGIEDANYHLVTASSVAQGDWTAICCAGRVIEPNRSHHLWDELGDAKCADCDGLSGDAMRAQIAEEKTAGSIWE
jgi:hypothetical protein